MVEIFEYIVRDLILNLIYSEDFIEKKKSLHVLKK